MSVNANIIFLCLILNPPFYECVKVHIIYIKLCFVYISILLYAYKCENMDRKKIIDLVGFVKISPYQVATLKFIGDGMKMPVEIGKHLSIGTSHASNILKTLSDNNLVRCINPERKKGRLYENTELAKEVMKYLD